jgi:ribosome-associated translation inhibitor RaiA
MRIQTRAKGDAIVEYVERRLSFAVGRMAERVGHVSVRVDREGVTKRCRILMELRNVGPNVAAPPQARREDVPRAPQSHRMLVVEAASDDAFEAVDHAVDRAAQRMIREYERGRERDSERVVSHLAADPSELDLVG